MSIKKTAVAVRLAVTAAALAGVAGLGWAQPPSTGTENTATAKLVYTVDALAEIAVTQKAGLKDQDLLNSDVLGAFSPANGEAAGSLGTIRVKTNAPNWDVTVSAQNGGRLIDESSATTGPPGCSSPVDVFGNCPPGNVTPGPLLGGETLTYTTTNTTDARGVIKGESGNPDTVQLEVAVGMGTLGAVLSASAPSLTAVYAFGIPAPVTPQLIPFAALKGSDVAPVSLAATIGGGSYATAAGALSPPITGVSGRIWADIASNGFGVPSHNDAWVPAANRNEEYFFVNVGFNQALKGNVGKNKGGAYSETFTFKLIAAY